MAKRYASVLLERKLNPPPSCSAVQSRRMRAVTIACQALPYLGDWYWTLPYLGGVCQDTALSGRGLEHLDYALSE